MNILVAPDKFKGSLTAEEVAEAIEQGVRAYNPDIEILTFPLADGGDGTAAILTRHFRGRFIKVNVHNPVFEIIEAVYGYAETTKTAFIEMSSASGLRLIPGERQDPLYTTTFGTGEMIRDAIERGAEKILLGIGGSATNDAGTGMAAALGYRFYDRNGAELKPIGENLSDIHRIDDSSLLFNPGRIDVQIACDVDNPLHGKMGAAFVYGPQKGASPGTVEKLDKGLKHFASVVKKKYGKDISCLPGAGAAGGLGGGAVVFLNARLRKGIELVMDATGFEQHLETADLIITGEGKMDEQTFQGKVVDGVCKLASRNKIPVLAVCGDLQVSEPELKKHGIFECCSLIDYFSSPEDAFHNARKGIIQITNTLLRNYFAYSDQQLRITD